MWVGVGSSFVPNEGDAFVNTLFAWLLSQD